MAIIVVGGSARNAGKTSLICGLLAALPEFRWVAIKITPHVHGSPLPICEETAPGQGTDTARFLTAGARRAFLIAAPENDLPALLGGLRATLGAASHLILESNRILDSLQPDLCLAVFGSTPSEPKPSFAQLARLADATVVAADRDRRIDAVQPVFELADLNRISPPFEQWLRGRLSRSAP